MSARKVKGTKYESIPCDKHRLLLVDDEIPILEMFKLVLSTALPGVSIDVAMNGLEAVKAFTSKHHGVLLMDLHMPVMTGQVAFREIERVRKEKNWEMPAVVFCTGYAPPATVKKVVASDSTHCLLSKPVKMDTLIEAVKNRL